MEDFVAPLIPEGGGIMEAITLSSLITDANAVITAVGTDFASLSNSFGAMLYIPVVLVLAKAIIGMVKGILLFKRGRRR